MARKPGKKAKAAKKAPPKPALKKKPAKPKAKPAKAPAPAAKAPKPAPVARLLREEFEEETVCSLEFLSDGRSFIARIDTNRGGMREHRAPSFMDLLELVAEDLREEFSEA
ncbi:MAG: hypothetical protein HY557_02500 [Euryarchaeota archaeon]|nr:hypothetical protein [Euryarchaeota archaeon]